MYPPEISIENSSGQKTLELREHLGKLCIEILATVQDGKNSLFWRSFSSLIRKYQTELLADIDSPARLVFLGISLRSLYVNGTEDSLSDYQRALLLELLADHSVFVTSWPEAYNIEEMALLGPLPPSSVLAEYEKVLPGSSEKLFELAQRQGELIAEAEVRIAELDKRFRVESQIIASAASVAALGAAIAVSLLGGHGGLAALSLLALIPAGLASSVDLTGASKKFVGKTTELVVRLIGRASGHSHGK